jgi:hypothetical protein
VLLALGNSNKTSKSGTEWNLTKALIFGKRKKFGNGKFDWNKHANTLKINNETSPKAFTFRGKK